MPIRLHSPILGVFRSTHALLLLCVLNCSVSMRAQSAEFSFGTVALKGQHAPGTPAGVLFGDFIYTQRYISPTGQVVFQADLTGTGITTGSNSVGNWMGSSGSLSLIARTTDPAPGMVPGATYSSISPAELNSTGQVSFKGTVTGTGITFANNSAIWFGTPGNLVTAARDGDQAPGVNAGVKYSSFNTVSLNKSGQIAFQAQLTGSGVNGVNNIGLWSGAPGNIGLIARIGDQAPGMPSGIKYALFGTTNASPPINELGQSVFIGSITGTGVTASNNNALWFGTPGNVTLLARTGDQPPGTAAGAKFQDFSIPTLNSAGQSAFVGFLTGSGVNSTNSSGIWTGTSGNLQLLARAGDNAPGTASGVNFNIFQGDSTTPQINASGQNAFSAYLSGTGVSEPNDTGIWLGKPGNVKLVAREGDAALGTNNSNLVFGDMQTTGPLALNDRGNIAFFNLLKDTTVSNSSFESIWFADSTTNALALVAMEGNQFQVSPGDLRVINSLSF
ncbi:MAG: hypothetical protein QOD99_2189, partial [Chthoniobacter sp.]|nr:hypothetical protein [Chthoniobacter sp.]